MVPFPAGISQPNKNVWRVFTHRKASGKSLPMHAARVCHPDRLSSTNPACTQRRMLEECHTLKGMLSRNSSGDACCPVSHMNKSGFSTSRTVENDSSAAGSMRGIFFSAHMPTRRSSSRNPRWRARYNSRFTEILRCFSSSLTGSPRTGTPERNPHRFMRQINL